MPCPSHPPHLNYSNNTWQRVQTVIYITRINVKLGVTMAISNLRSACYQFLEKRFREQFMMYEPRLDIKEVQITSLIVNGYRINTVIIQTPVSSLSH
jgi:hypothetical protein